MNNTPQNENRKHFSVVIATLVLCTIILPLFGNSASEAYVPELQNRIKSVEQKNTPVDLKKWFFNPYYHWVLRYYYDEIASDITVFRNSDVDDISYTYDANGNLKQRITTAGIEEIIYNPRNQPIAILKSGEKVASFTYDSIGMRNRSLDLESGKQQDYLREGRKVLAEMDGKGANRKVYRYGNGPMGYVANGLPQFTSRDPVGSPFAVSSSTGKLLETRQYEPFGASTATMDSVNDYPDVHIHFQHSTLADSATIGDISTTDQNPKTGTVIADLPLDGADGESFEPALFLTIGDDPDTTHLPVHQVPLIMVTDLPPPYMTLEADTLVFEATTTDPIIYTLTIEPVGNTFNDVTITIPLPKTVEYNTTTSGQEPLHDPITNTLTWNYSQLSGTQTIEFTINVDFIKNYDTWLDLQATLTATELIDTNRLSNTASTAIYNNGLVSLITPKADFDPSFTNKPTAYAFLDPDPLATEQTINCEYKVKLLGETSQNTQTFVGKETDSHTGLMYFGARFYDPVIGRFITEDPYIGNIWEARSLQRYPYAFNNPIAYIDQHGEVASKVGKKGRKIVLRPLIKKFKANFYNRLRKIYGREIYQIHHIIGREFAQKGTEIGEFLARKVGFDVQHQRNVIELPTILGKKMKVEGWEKSVHIGGKHLDSYVKPIEEKILFHYQRYKDAPKHLKERILSETKEDIIKMQDNLRKGLEKGEINLYNPETIDALMNGKSIYIASINTSILLSVDGFIEAINADLDEKVKGLSSYSKYLTATNYTGDSGFWGWLGWAIDFFNPGDTAYFASILIEDLEDISEMMGRLKYGANYENVIEVRDILNSYKLQIDRWIKQPESCVQEEFHHVKY